MLGHTRTQTWRCTHAKADCLAFLCCLSAQSDALFCNHAVASAWQEHTFQRANDLAVKGLEKLPLKEVRVLGL